MTIPNIWTCDYCNPEQEFTDEFAFDNHMISGEHPGISQRDAQLLEQIESDYP